MRSRVIGLITLLLTMITWVSFALSVRALPGTGFTGMDSTTIRFVTPALILLPWWPLAWREVRRAKWYLTLALVIGAGAPFYLLTLLGGEHSSASHILIFNLGLAPLMVVLVGFVLHRRQHITLLSGTGLVAVAAGMAVVTLAIPGSEVGVMFLLLSSLLWAIFTLAQEAAGFHPMATGVIISVPSALFGLAVDGPRVVGLAVTDTGPFLLLMLVQGVGAGVLATVLYVVAINALGARLTTFIAAFTPALVTIAAVFVLDEVFPPLGILGLAIVIAGMIAQAPGTVAEAPLADPEGSPETG